MKIRKVKPDAEDYTLSIPSAILPGQLRPVYSLNCWKPVNGNQQHSCIKGCKLFNDYLLCRVQYKYTGSEETFERM